MLAVLVLLVPTVLGVPVLGVRVLGVSQVPQVPHVPQVHVRASQLGYLPSDPKIAVVFSTGALPDRFAVIDERGTVALQGKPRPSVTQRWGSFTAHADLDFTPLQRPGRYRIRYRYNENTWADDMEWGARLAVRDQSVGDLDVHRRRHGLAG